MDKKVLDYVVEKTKELMGTATCSAEAKAAAQAWLDAVGTAAEAGETKKYIGGKYYAAEHLRIRVSVG